VDNARMDELQLVQRCKEGSESAFAELVRRHRPRLYTLAYRLTSDRDTAEDVVQETFVAAFRALDRFEPRPSLAAWLNTIALRNAGKVVARSTNRPRASLDAMLDDDEAAGRLLAATATDRDDPHQAAEAAELRRELSAAIAALPFKYRAAVVTRYVLGLDYAEAAASLEMGLNTFKSHLLRGTRMLRELLTSFAETDGLPVAAEATAASTPEPASRPAPPIAAVSATSSAAPLGVGAHTVRTPAMRSYTEPRRARFDAVAKEKAVRG
jgi:RNA polymerase sigma-70 factor (ECF subfamily)